MADLTEQSEHREPDATWKFWMAEIEAARKREKDWRKEGEDILKLYEANAETPAPFNILYSNTETMMPALYSRVPRPYVERRFKDNDEMGFHAAKAGTRILEFLLDTNLDNYDNFHEAIKQSTLAAVLPGRGWTSIKYEAEITGDVTQWETICPEINSWKKVYHGYARKWTNVPWVAYEKEIDKDEAERLFGKELAKKLNYTSDRPEGDDKDKKDNQDQHRGERKTCPIYKIWDKDGGKMVRWFSPNYKDGMLKEEDDPLGLSGFFDCPKPLQFIEKHDSLLPTAPYSLYRTQAQELNELTRRIMKIEKAIKARGVYDGSLGDELKKIMTADDNELVPADSASSLATEKGFENAIWFLPIEQLVVTLRELVAARELCKQTIYEITGISDILRGATKASETLGAQEIKNQWGTLRLKNKQAEVQRFSRDLLRMTLELAASKFSEETWAQMTGLPFSTSLQREQAQQVLQAAMLSGQPPDPQAAAIMQAPAWADVIKMLQDDLQRAYRIDIETNSTVEPEAAEDHKHIQEMMMTLGQVLQGLTPLVTSGTMPFQMVQDLLLVIARRYRFGNEIEDHIKSMQPPKPPDENGAEQVKKEKEFAQKEIQMKQKEAEGAIKSKDLDHQMNVKQREMQLKMKEMEVQMREIQAQHEKGLAALELKMQEQMAGKNIQMKAQDATFKVKQAQQQSKQSQQQRRTA
jgi:hypothetical protein